MVAINSKIPPPAAPATTGNMELSSLLVLVAGTTAGKVGAGVVTDSKIAKKQVYKK